MIYKCRARGVSQGTASRRMKWLLTRRMFIRGLSDAPPLSRESIRPHRAQYVHSNSFSNRGGFAKILQYS